LPISASDTINPALEHAKKQLFQPFRFSQWVRLALVGLLAGELGSGGCNGSYHVPATHQPKGTEQALNFWDPAQAGHITQQLAAWIIPLLLVGFVFFVLFLYVSSVMRFVLFDSVVAKECHVRESWKRRTNEGYAYFVWQITIMLLMLAAMLLLIGFPLFVAWSSGWLNRPKDHLLPLVLGGVLLVFLLIALAVIMGVIHVMTKDFVVPQMALEHISAFEGWRRLWPWMMQEKVGYAAYIGMKIVLAIGAGIALGIVAIFVVVLVALPIGGAGVVAVLAAKAAGWTWNFYTIAVVALVGAIVLAILIFLVSLINVPAIVFFPAYSIYFLASRYRPLAELMWPAAPQTGNAPPPVPPLPPLPEATD
jgi:hypothetical protein